MDRENEYIVFFKAFPERLKEEYALLHKDSLEKPSSKDKAYIDVINSFPCPIQVVRLKVNTVKHKKAKNSIYHLIKYDFSHFGKESIKYYSEIDFDKLEKNSKVIKAFGLDSSKVMDIRNFKLKGASGSGEWSWISIVSCDILEESQKYYRDFLMFFCSLFWKEILDRFEKRIDFNKKYKLQKDPIKPLSEIIKKDKIISRYVAFEKSGGRREFTIEDIQKSICSVQLIPGVPEDVTNVFNAAKKLYIFSYFEYYFLTISLHYASLALESALRNRYNDFFGSPKDFVNLYEVIKRLADKGIIPEGEEKVYNSWREIRNYLSHLTEQKRFPPFDFDRIAYQINVLYDYKE